MHHNYKESFDFAKCQNHYKTFMYYHQHTYDFLCPDCITDKEIQINRNHLKKLSGNSVALKEFHIENIKEMSKLKEWVDNNMREIRLRRQAFERVDKEASSLVKQKIRRVYEELKRAEGNLTDELKKIVKEKMEKFNKLEVHHREVLKVFASFKKNMN